MSITGVFLLSSHKGIFIRCGQRGAMGRRLMRYQFHCRQSFVLPWRSEHDPTSINHNHLPRNAVNQHLITNNVNNPHLRLINIFALSLSLFLSFFLFPSLWLHMLRSFSVARPFNEIKKNIFLLLTLSSSSSSSSPSPSFFSNDKYNNRFHLDMENARYMIQLALMWQFNGNEENRENWSRRSSNLLENK